MITLLLLVRVTYILLFFAHIPFMVNHTFNAAPPERLQHMLICFMGETNLEAAQCEPPDI